MVGGGGLEEEEVLLALVPEEGSDGNGQEGVDEGVEERGGLVGGLGGRGPPGARPRAPPPPICRGQRPRTSLESQAGR